MNERISRKQVSAPVLNRTQNALASQFPAALQAVNSDSQQTSRPMQARFGHDFSRLASGPEANTTLQRAAPEEELQMKIDPNSPIQRAAPEEELQMKTDSSTIQRAGPEEEELQMKADLSTPVQRAGTETQAKPNNTGLPDSLKSGVENLSGVSLNDVNVHYNSSQPKGVGALAYAQGTDIHVASGQEQHLPHEAWHVVQQKQGRVQPTFQMKTGVSINDDQSLESEADVMGAKAAAMSNEERKA